MKRKRHRRHQQLELQAYPTERPPWKNLPAGVQQRALRLIAQLLREAHARSAGGEGQPGERDE